MATDTTTSALRIEFDPRMPSGVLALDDEAGLAVMNPDDPRPRRSALLLGAGYLPNAAGEWARRDA